MKKNIVIVGAGRIGAALAGILHAQHIVDCCDVDPTKVPNQKELHQIVPPAHIVFLCVPSWAVRNAVDSFRPHLNANAVVVAFAKGIEAGSKLTMDKVLKDALPAGQRYAMFGGPMMAEEIAKNMDSYGVIGSTSHEVYEDLIKVFHHTKVHLFYDADPMSVAMAGVLKNIYAVALGIVDGLGWGVNTKGNLASQAFSEMLGVAEMLGARHATIMGQAGLGDFLATGFSVHSRNRTVGDQLVSTGTYTIKSEGIESIPPVLGLLGTRAASFPILIALKRVLLDQEKVEKVFAELL